jgi:hypothetical protein
VGVKVSVLRFPWRAPASTLVRFRGIVASSAVSNTMSFSSRRALHVVPAGITRSASSGAARENRKAVVAATGPSSR